MPFHCPLEWAVATADWVNAPGNGSTVACNIAKDMDGTPFDPPRPITLFLPRPDNPGFKKALDPNVKAGDVLGFFYDHNDKPICITDCCDAAIGSSKWWHGPEANIPRGWRKISAAAGRYTVAAGPGINGDYDPSTLGATGGNTRHKHSVTVNVSVSGTTSTASLSGTGSGSATLTGGTINGSGTAAVTFGSTGGGTTISTNNAATNITANTTGSATLSGGGISVTGTPTSLVTFSKTFAFGGTFSTQSGTTGITLDDHSPHSHSLPIDNLNYEPGLTPGPYDLTAGSTGTVTLDHAGLVNDPGHTHLVNRADVVDACVAGLIGEVDVTDVASYMSLSGTVTLSGITVNITDPQHLHTIDKSAIAAALTGTVSITDIKNALSISGSVSLTGITVDIPDHSHTFSGSGSDTVDTDEKVHINPFYALYLIERFE